MRLQVTLINTFLVFSLFYSPVFTHAQDSLSGKPNVSVGFDLASQYMWRGLVLSQGPVIQPSAEIAMQGWAFGLWGSTSFDKSENKELDAYLNYSLEHFRFSVIDYYTYTDSAAPSYFNFKKNESAHLVETIAEFTGNEKIPFRLLAGINVFGDSNHSAYVETAWMTTVKETAIEIVAGYTPQKGFYHPLKYGFTNIGCSASNSISLNSNNNLNIKFSAFYAPMVKQTYFVIILGLH